MANSLLTKNTSHWRSDIDQQGILWLILDQKDASTNVLSAEVLQQLDSILDKIHRELPLAVVFKSAKSSGFIAGADINEFLQVTNQQEALILIRRGQGVFNKIEALSCPTIALIDGFCMGGGTELVLACDYRIASDNPSTRIGLPEVKLGIHPGFGGVVRLTRLVNPFQALEMMLSGRALSARDAKKIGLVDYVQPERQLTRAVTHIALTTPPKRKLPWTGTLLSLPLIRSLVTFIMKKQVAKKASIEHYPAPYALLDVWNKYYGSPSMMEQEAKSVASLVQGETVRNLIRVFFLQSRLKGLADKHTFQPRHVHVIGAGIMGGDIAAWCALKGFRVTLQEREAKYLSNAFARAHQLFARKLKTQHERNQAIDRLIPDCDGNGVAHADVIIEAIFENIEAKHAIYKDIEPRMRKDAVLATNTSSIPLETLAAALQQPERLVGLHFFNPVAMMPLVEIVKKDDTPASVVNQASAFSLHIGKLPLPVKSSPGFLVNRILVPYLIEAVTLHEEGIAIEAIDKAAIDFGMPMGPVELADAVGLDICLSVATNLSSFSGFQVPEILKKMVAAKTLGKKTGSGFYQYKKGHPIKDHDANMGLQQEIQNRLIYRLLNESAACLREGIVDDLDLLDAGVIFGTGFAPFRGGPLNYGKDSGVNSIQQNMKIYQQRFGDRFEPDEGWTSV
ncbi:MAG: enoyl-CoA hydratase/isomerase family protein [Gammaproteobacteria bacterium]|nr:enoyl-CoA hydratase/isomerase family protein [Gammaproteobacteria bacterium]MBL6999695.1 enoyl-CoA hydratase/isomerase family protein [Gammaproteobacteria bacterium]